MGRPKSATRLTKAEINRRYRDRKRGGPKRQPLPFWDRVEKGESCWLWRGSRSPQGYGALWFQGARWRAHRLAWHLTHGGVPSTLDVLHRCDNPACVRPAHLFLGTDKDNASDREQKRRGNHYEGHGRAKLTAAAVDEIRCSYRRGSSTHGGVALARKFGVHHQRIYSIVAGKAWK